MPSVTIIGAGVFGLTIAHALPLAYDVTILARDIPGDAESQDWASPWAGATFGFGSTTDPIEREILETSFRDLWEMAERFPESTVKKITEHRFRDDTDTDDDFWWRTFAPDYRILAPSELPPNARARIAVSYTTLVLNAPKYIVWLAARLRARGVSFVRGTVASLAEVQSGTFARVPDVIVNATGLGARVLGGVEDADVLAIRGQNMLIADPEGKLDKTVLRTGDDYCYIIPRLDGTVIIGGIKEPNDPQMDAKPELRAEICARVHELDPRVPASPADVHLLRDIIAFRPGRRSGLRVERELIDGIKVVHAYGGAGDGYAFSFGVGRRVARYVDELVYGRAYESAAAEQVKPGGSSALQ